MPHNSSRASVRPAKRGAPHVYCFQTLSQYGQLTSLLAQLFAMRVIEVVIDVCAIQNHLYAPADILIGLQVVRRQDGHIRMVRKSMSLETDKC